MKHKNITFLSTWPRFLCGWLFFATGFLLGSCDPFDPCRNLDCISSIDYGQFRIVRKTDDKDLVFGPNKIYDKNNIKFYSLDGADTHFFNYRATKGSGQFDSILYVDFSPITDVVYMKLSDNDIDTLNISYKVYGTKCCGTITEITKFRFNDTLDITGGYGTTIIEK